MDEATWFDVARRCGHATFFQTPIWMQLALGTLPVRDATRLFALPDGARVVFPLVEIDRRLHGRFTILASAPFGTYGGIIADRTISADEQAWVYDSVLRGDTGELRVLENPYAPALPDRRVSGAEHHFTDRIPLDPDPDVVARRFSQERRREIRKGRAGGVTVRRAGTIEDFRAYYDIYEASLRRWHKTHGYPWRLLELGHELTCRYPEHMKLWLAERDGEILAGEWIFYWNGIASGWHAVALEQGLRVKAATVLLSTTIADACQRGLDWYDLNPSGGLKGVADYKKQWGAVRKPIRRLYYERRRLVLLRSAKRPFVKLVT